MTIEAQLDALTSAITTLTKVLQEQGSSRIPTEQKHSHDPKTSAPVKGKKPEPFEPAVSETKDTAEPQSTAPTEDPAGSEEPPAGPEALTYADLAAKFIALMKAKGQPAGVGVLESFGIKNLAHLTEDQYPEAAQRIDAAGAV